MTSEVDQTTSAQASAATAPIALQGAIAVKQILPWAILCGLVMLLAYYFVGAEQGATHLFSGMSIHEFVHDARHLLGFPCH